MADDCAKSVIDGLRLLAAAQTPPHVTDRELLGRFAARRDEAAFAALVVRHTRNDDFHQAIAAEMAGLHTPTRLWRTTSGRTGLD